MLAELVHPSPAVCAALTTLTRLLPAPNGPSQLETHTRRDPPRGGEGFSGRGECWQSARGDSRCAGGGGRQGWYVGMHVRQSGLWDPAGSSPAGLFALRDSGPCPRSLAVPVHMHASPTSLCSPYGGSGEVRLSPSLH